MNKTKNCKYCKTEIDSKAKVCPNCKKKQGGKAKFIIIALIVVFAIAASMPNEEGDGPTAVNTASDSNKTDDSKVSGSENDKKEEAKVEEKTEFGVGEAVELKDVITTLVSVTESNGSDYNKPADGNVFLLCEFNVENNSSSDLAISSIVSFEAYCDDYSINQSITGLLEAKDKNQLDGSIAAGKKMNGIIAYEVSKDWKDLEINFTPSFWSGKDILFSVKNK